MNAFPAEIPEIVRSHRKDEEYLDDLRNALSDVFKDLAGPRRWIKWYSTLGLVADFCYYGLTTLSGSQTLGEEYLRLVQIVEPENPQLPSFFRRFLFIVLQVAGPRFATHLLGATDRHLTAQDLRSHDKLIKVIRWLKSHLNSFFRLHLALFYILGRYYHLAKRITGVNYLSLRAQTNLEALRLFRWLGYISLAQTTVSLGFWVYSKSVFGSVPTKLQTDLASGDIAETEIKRLDVSGSFSCPLCLESGKSPACTPCGHIFCWNCILEQSNQAKSCPSCRSPIVPDRIIPLFNL